MSARLTLACAAVLHAVAASALPAPPSQLSKAFRNWHYVNGSYDGFVVPPLAGGFESQALVDVATVFEKAPEDTVTDDKWRMTYLFFHGAAGDKGYESALATSPDLVNWSFGRGGDKGKVFARSGTPGAFDYGGVVLGGALYDSADLRAPRRLLKTSGAYHQLYGCYPSRSGYEAGDGGEGAASSKDGVTWTRVSTSVPALNGSTGASAAWENGVVYMPFLLHGAETNGTVYNFYNALGTNQYGRAAEESGFTSIPTSSIPGVSEAGSLWQMNKSPENPVLPSSPPGAVDTYQTADPKIFWDSEQKVWVCFYFGNGDGSNGHATIMAAFSTDLIHWEKDPEPLYRAGGHPMGIDADHAHKVSVVYSDGVGYMYYTAVGPKGRGIALLTSKPVQ